MWTTSREFGMSLEVRATTASDTLSLSRIHTMVHMAYSQLSYIAQYRRRTARRPASRSGNRTTSSRRAPRVRALARRRRPWTTRRTARPPRGRCRVSSRRRRPAGRPRRTPVDSPDIRSSPPSGRPRTSPNSRWPRRRRRPSTAGSRSGTGRRSPAPPRTRGRRRRRHLLVRQTRVSDGRQVGGFDAQEVGRPDLPGQRPGALVLPVFGLLAVGDVREVRLVPPLHRLVNRRRAVHPARNQDYRAAVTPGRVLPSCYLPRASFHRSTWSRGVYR